MTGRDVEEIVLFTVVMVVPAACAVASAVGAAYRTRLVRWMAVKARRAWGAWSRERAANRLAVPE